MGVCNCSMFCCTLLYVHSSIAIILIGKRELVALLNLSYWCLMIVWRLFLAVPRGCLRVFFMMVVFHDHTHLLFFSVGGTPSQLPAFYLAKASAKFEVATSNGLGGDAFTRKYIISPLSLTIGQGHIRSVAQYPLHHMTYEPAKFEVALSNGLGGNAFTRNI